MKTPMTRRAALSKMFGGLSAAALAGSMSFSQPVLAHEADCPHCGLPVVQDTDTLDNEVTLKFGRKRIEYRCVYCALSEAHSEYKGDLSILAPTETKGVYVLLKRDADQWTANMEKDGQWQPSEDVVFIGEKVNHRHCQTGYRALTSRAAFEAYAKKHKETVGEATPRTLEQMLELAKPKAAS